MIFKRSFLYALLCSQAVSCGWLSHSAHAQRQYCISIPGWGNHLEATAIGNQVLVTHKNIAYRYVRDAAFDTQTRLAFFCIPEQTRLYWPRNGFGKVDFDVLRRGIRYSGFVEPLNTSQRTTVFSVPRGISIPRQPSVSLQRPPTRSNYYEVHSQAGGPEWALTGSAKRGRVVLAKTTGGPSQRWATLQTGPGAYRIFNEALGPDWSMAITANGQLEMRPSSDSPSQEWTLDELPGGAYQVVNPRFGLLVGVDPDLRPVVRDDYLKPEFAEWTAHPVAANGLAIDRRNSNDGQRQNVARPTDTAGRILQGIFGGAPRIGVAPRAIEIRPNEPITTQLVNHHQRELWVRIDSPNAAEQSTRLRIPPGGVASYTTQSPGSHRVTVYDRPVTSVSIDATRRGQPKLTSTGSSAVGVGIFTMRLPRLDTATANQPIDVYESARRQRNAGAVTPVDEAEWNGGRRKSIQDQYIEGILRRTR